MPALMWVTFWSCLMGSAACWGEVPRADADKQSGASKESSSRRDQPAV
jgi:hypothetical protein